MNIPPTDDDLARAHEVFRKNHDAGRQRLVETLSNVDSSIAPLAPYRSFTLSGRMIGKLALAATVLAALTLGLYFWHSSAQRAYALEDLPNRLLELHSIYMSGWTIKPDGQKRPTTLFAERPNRYWYTRHLTSGPDATHEHSRVVSEYVACNGGEELSVCIDDKKAWVDNLPPIASELTTEQIFQHQVMSSLLGTHGTFGKTGSEMVGGIRCDVYEGRWVFKWRVWLDPKRGLPVQMADYDIDKAGQERMFSLCDRIEINVSANDKGLSFAPPEGYQVTRKDDANPLSRLASSRSPSSGKLTSGYYLNIDEKAVLVCWACDTGSGDKIGHGEVTFLIGQDRECNNIKMATVQIDGREWNWSLVFPKESGERIGSDGLKIISPWNKSHSGGVPNAPLRFSDVQIAPLRFPEERLRSIIEEIQLATKTVPAGGKPFTLDMLRARLGGG